MVIDIIFMIWFMIWYIVTIIIIVVSITTYNIIIVINISIIINITISLLVLQLLVSLLLLILLLFFYYDNWLCPGYLFNVVNNGQILNLKRTTNIPILLNFRKKNINIFFRNYCSQYVEITSSTRNKKSGRNFQIYTK